MKALIRQHRTFPALFLFLRLLMVNVVWKASGSAEEPTTIRRVIGPSIYNQSGTFRGRCEGGGGGGGGGAGGEVLFLDAAVLFFGQSTGDCPDGRCPVDVTVRLSELCSARSNNYNNCEVPVRSLCNDTSCATTTTTTTTQASLNVTYSCLRVVSRNCRHKCSEMSRLTDAEGYLTGDTGGSPLPLGERACGTSDCPWQIQVQPGQNIEVSLYHLGGGTQRSGASSSSQRGSRLSSTSGDASCFAVKERANPKEFQDCVVGGARARQRVVYTTVSNTVQLRLTQRQERFLLHYRATGCPDIVPPYNSRMKRTGDRCEIDCPGSEIRWTLTCEGNRWAGTEKLDKCPGKFYAPGSLPDPQRTSSEPESGSGSASSWPMSVLITAVVAVTVIIAVLVLTIGFVLLKKHQYEAKLGDPLLYGAPTSEFEFCTDFVPVRPGGGSAAPPRTATARSSRSGSGPGTRRSLELLGPPVVRGEGTYYAGDRQLLEMQPLHRPLPMIPAALGGGPGGGGGVDGGRTGSWRPGPVDPKKIMVQLHRTGSGTMSVIPPYPTMMMRDGRLLPCNCGPQALSSQASIHRPPSHLYFTLDPEIQVEEPATLGRNYPAIEQGGGGGGGTGGGGEDRMNTMPRGHQQRANASPPLPPPPPPAPEMMGAEVNQRAVLPPPPPPEDMSHMEMIPLNLTNPTRARQQAVAGQIQDAGQTPLNLTPPHRKSTSSGHEGQQQQQGFRQKSCVEAHS